MDDKTYFAWYSARRRCTDRRDVGYKYYGGRGIKMLYKSYRDFLADMGIVPKGLCLDRIDNNGNYKPGNCRWVTPAQSNRNKRSNKLITFLGVTLVLTDWCKLYNINFETLRHRLYYMGWTLEEAFGFVKRKFPKRTHCRRGHNKEGRRVCLTCQHKSQAEYQQRKKHGLVPKQAVASRLSASPH